MSHFLTRRRSNSSDIGTHRFRNMCLDELSGFFFSRTTNFTDHDDRISLWIILKFAQAINEVGTRHWVSTDTYTSTHTNATLLEFIQRLICQSS